MTERLRQAVVATQQLGARSWQAARSRSRKQVGILAAVVAGLIGGYYAVHFATAHRSQCPAVAQTIAGTKSGDSASRATTPRAAPFSVLVDAIKPVDVGDAVDLYYDVCGLTDGTTFTTLVNVSRNKSGISKLFTGGGQSVSQNFQETADSPAERRHRDIDVSALPAGAYTIRVIATDARERTRERSVQLHIRAKEAR